MANKVARGIKLAKLWLSQYEIMRAVKAAQDMGFGVKSIVINPLAGTITIEPVIPVNTRTAILVPDQHSSGWPAI